MNASQAPPGLPARSGSLVGAPGTLLSLQTTGWITLTCCFLAAIVEGIEIVSFGVAAPELRTALGLQPASIGFLASAGVVGLIFGAFFGGRLADRIGAKKVLMFSVLGSALFALASALSHHFATLLVARLLVGMAVGVTMPNIIALSAEAGPERGEVARVSIVSAGMPAGGVVMGIFAATSLAHAWQSAFWFGTVVPALLLPLLGVSLPAGRSVPALRASEEDPGAPRPLAGYRFVLFGEGRAWSTVALWVSGFANQVIIFLLLSWLPTLMRAVGATRPEAVIAMALFNVGGVLGGFLFGPLMRRNTRWPVPAVSYTGSVIGLLALLLPNLTVSLRLFASLLLGVCAIGSQLLVLGLSAETYDARYRGTGVGTATAVGRVGSTVGPMIAGLAFSTATTSPAILIVLLPLAIFAGGGSILLAMSRPRGSIR